MQKILNDKGFRGFKIALIQLRTSNFYTNKAKKSNIKGDAEKSSKTLLTIASFILGFLHF